MNGVRMLLLWSCLISGIASAASTVEVHVFDDPALEARYYGLIDELRCPKCQNTNLAGSDAPIAHDLRGTVYRLLTEKGMSDSEIRDYLVERYGDFVLYDPPFNPWTSALWLVPIAALVAGVLLLRRFTARPPALALSAEEEALIAALDREDPEIDTTPGKESGEKHA